MDLGPAVPLGAHIRKRVSHSRLSQPFTKQSAASSSNEAAKIEVKGKACRSNQLGTSCYPYHRSVGRNEKETKL